MDFRPVQGPAWKNPMAYGPGEKREQGDLVDFQRTLALSSRMVHPRKSSKGSRSTAWINRVFDRPDGCVDLQRVIDRLEK